MPLTDAEREELKTLIRETIREMAKESAEIAHKRMTHRPTWKEIEDFAESLRSNGDTNERHDSR